MLTYCPYCSKEVVYQRTQRGRPVAYCPQHGLLAIYPSPLEGGRKQDWLTPRKLIIIVSILALILPLSMLAIILICMRIG